MAGPGGVARCSLIAGLALLSLLPSVSARAAVCTSDYLAQLQAVRNDLDAGGDTAADIARLRDIAGRDNAGFALAPVVSDLETGDLGSAKHRLDSIKASLEVPANTVCNMDTGGARDALHKVYQSPVFADLDKPVDRSPSLLQRIVEAIGRLVGGVMTTLGTAGTILVGAVILGLVLGFALWRLRQISATGRRGPAAEPAAAAIDPEAEWRLGVEAAGRGDHREAIRRVFRSALLSVATRGRLGISAAWTTRELLGHAGSDPELVSLLGPAAAGFDRAWYSGETVTSDDWETARRQCQEIRTLAAQRPRLAA